MQESTVSRQTAASGAATVAVPAPAAAPLSADGAWWWNGRRWVPAVSEDGLWRWDGSRWAPTVDLDSKRPEDVATGLRLLAERRYAEAGAVLGERSHEWTVSGPLRELVSQLEEVRRQRARLAAGIRQPEGGRGLLGRLSSEDSGQLQKSYESVEAEHHRITVTLGRNAPRPSVKEADDVLAVARLLDERAGLLTAGLAEVDEAERMRADAAVAAQQELEAAERTRARALEQASAAVRAAEAAHAQAVHEARARLADVLNPGPGELRVAMGPLRLFANLLEAPTGRQPAAGLAAHVDTAPPLWREHRTRLWDLLLMEAPGTKEFRSALSQRGAELFLLVVGRAGSSLVVCPPGQERAARRFAATVAEHAPEAAQTEEARQMQAQRAEDQLDAIARDRSPIDGAEAELARIDGDPALQGAIDDARQRLNRARTDTPEVIEARRKLLDLARRLTAAPPNLNAER